MLARVLQKDMLAWRLYCTGRSRGVWLEQLEEMASKVEERHARIARARAEHPELRERALAKQEFVPVGRREVARW